MRTHSILWGRSLRRDEFEFRNFCAELKRQRKHHRQRLREAFIGWCGSSELVKNNLDERKKRERQRDREKILSKYIHCSIYRKKEVSSSHSVWNRSVKAIRSWAFDLQEFQESTIVNDGVINSISFPSQINQGCLRKIGVELVEDSENVIPWETWSGSEDSLILFQWWCDQNRVEKECQVIDIYEGLRWKVVFDRTP